MRLELRVRHTDPPLFGQRYSTPARACMALEYVLGAPVGDVRVIEYSRYARFHPGMTATTRPNHILLAGSGDEFVSDTELLLHEYFHVLYQWNTGRLTRYRYLIEWARFGYWNNRFEREARDFATATAERYRNYFDGSS